MRPCPVRNRAGALLLAGGVVLGCRFLGALGYFFLGTSMRPSTSV